MIKLSNKVVDVHVWNSHNIYTPLEYATEARANFM
jgi:hypothetical protein